MTRLENGVPVLIATVGAGRSRWEVTVTGHHGPNALHFQLFAADGRRLGLAACIRSAPGVVQLNDLRVNERFRRRGVGSALLEATLAALPELGVSHVDACTTPGDRHENPKLLGWYRAHGFRWDPTTFDLRGEVSMWWVGPEPPTPTEG